LLDANLRLRFLLQTTMTITTTMTNSATAPPMAPPTIDIETFGLLDNGNGLPDISNQINENSVQCRIL